MVILIKRVLVLTTELTGYGHKNISDTIKDSFAKYRNVEVKCVEAFGYTGDVTIALSQVYNKSVNTNLKLWKLMYHIAAISTKALGIIIGYKMEKRFIKDVNEFKPDFILSVHPIFVKSTAFVIRKNKINIPFGVLVTDIASINNIWLDKRPNIYFCTTEETQKCCLEYGIRQDKITMVKYPINKQYNTLKKNNIKFTKDERLSILMLSGGDGVLDFEGIASRILLNIDSRLTIVTGRNNKLKKRLEDNLVKQFEERIVVHGFVNRLSDLYLNHNIALIRASPNVMFEVSKCNIPAVIVSFIPGQETDNVKFAQDNNIALECLEDKNLVKTIRYLIADNGFMLNELKKKQERYIKSLSFSNIEDSIYNYID